MAKVIKTFRDKETKKIYAPGVVFDGTPERTKELQDKGFLEKPKQTKKGGTRKKASE